MTSRGSSPCHKKVSQLQFFFRWPPHFMCSSKRNYKFWNNAMKKKTLFQCISRYTPTQILLMTSAVIVYASSFWFNFGRRSKNVQFGLVLNQNKTEKLNRRLQFGYVRLMPCRCAETTTEASACLRCRNHVVHTAPGISLSSAAQNHLLSRRRKSAAINLVSDPQN